MDNFRVDKLIDALLEYKKEAEKNKYSYHTIRYDLRRMIGDIVEEISDSKIENYKAALLELAKEHYLGTSDSVFDAAYDYEDFENKLNNIDE